MSLQAGNGKVTGGEGGHVWGLGGVGSTPTSGAVVPSTRPVGAVNTVPGNKQQVGLAIHIT